MRLLHIPRFFRLSLIALPGTIALFLILRAFLDGNTADIRYAFGLLAILGLSICVTVSPSTQKMMTRRGFVALGVLALPILAVFPLTVVVLIFGKVDMAAFVFHLIFGMEGTPWHDILPFIFTAAVFWTVFLISFLRLMPHLPYGVILSLGLALLFLGINPLVNDLLLNRANAAFGPARTVLPEFREPALRQTGEKPDLVILYLEGFDRGYLDPARFGDIAAPIAALERRGTSFTRVLQIEATGWSLAGTIATQCGAPLLPFGAKPLGDTSSILRIMPDVTCLSDILHDRGYATTYMSGAKIIGNEMGYYGFDNFYSTHGYIAIEDRDTIPAERTAGFGPDDWGDWGIFDSELLDGAEALIRRKAQEDKPFAVFIATMDSHGPAASLSPACTEDGAPRTQDDMRDTIRCVSGLVAAFVDDLIKEHGPGLRIAILSDHLNHASNLIPLLEQAERTNTAILLGGDTPIAVHDRPASMVDIYPTLLDWLGLLGGPEPRAGLGVSLLSGAPTLVERMGFDALNTTLRVDTALARHLWRETAEAPD